MHYDGNGNVVLLTAAAGTASARYAYDAFGRLLSSSGPAAEANRYRFSTKPQERAAGLSYYGYRYYDSGHGRWLSRDPLEEEGGVNLYGMAGNDSISNFDRLGLDWSQSVVDALPNWAVEGLAATPYLPQGLVDGAAGMGDQLSLGATDWLRDQMDGNKSVDKCKWQYKAGEATGLATGLAIGIGAGRNALKVSKSAASELVAAPSSLYKEVTKAASRQANRATDVTAADFKSNLISSGYKVINESLGKNGPVTVVSDGAKTYTIYIRSSTGAPGAQLTNTTGDIIVKINLK